jgi:hypothetical protein
MLRLATTAGVPLLTSYTASWVAGLLRSAMASRPLSAGEATTVGATDHVPAGRVASVTVPAPDGLSTPRFADPPVQP